MPELPRAIRLELILDPVPAIRLTCEHGLEIGTYAPGPLDTLVVTSETGITVVSEPGNPGGGGEE